MGRGYKHKIGFILNYDEKRGCWKAEFQISNRRTEKDILKRVKRHKSGYMERSHLFTFELYYAILP